MNTINAIRLLAKNGATEDQMVGVLLAAKVSTPPPGMVRVFSGPAVKFVRIVVDADKFKEFKDLVNASLINEGNKASLCGVHKC